MEITYTTFVDFCAAQWGSKVSVIKHAKDQFGQDYDPARDYWKGMREAIVASLERGNAKAQLASICERATDRKVVNYRAAAEGAASWIRARRPEWVVSPPPVSWNSGTLTVRVNPELGVLLSGRRHVVKLYLRAGDKLTKPRVDAMLHLLELTHGTAETSVGILDVRRSRLITPTRLVPGIDALLNAEAAAFVSMWTSL